MEVSLEKFVKACEEANLSEATTIQLISKSFSPDKSSSAQLNPKDIPMKVKNNYTWGNHDQRPDGDCPQCGHSLSGNASTPKHERCPWCNQLLDWH